MLKAINYVRGHVQVSIEGAFPERFLNICSQNGISFWDLERLSVDHMKAVMHIKDFKRIRKYARRSMCRVRLQRKKGVPFFLWRFRKRFALLSGFALFLTAIYVLSLFIWDIDVVGAQTVPEDRILYGLVKNGVKIGTYTGSIDYETVKNKMLLDIKELSWITVNVKGSKATVEVRERIIAPEIIPRNIPCNIVASRSGVITSMDVLAGSAQVTRGQTVLQGQLLVSGVIDSSKVGARFVHAMADITARTWYNMTSKMPLKAKSKAYTGGRKTRYALILAGDRVNLYFDTSKPFDTYDKIIKKTQLKIFENVPLPVTLVTEKYLEYETASYEIPVKEAEEMIKENLKREARLAVIHGSIENMQFESQSSNGVAAVKLAFEAEEQIAQESEIPSAAYKNKQ